MFNSIQQFKPDLSYLPSPIKHVIKDTRSLFERSSLEPIALLFALILPAELFVVKFIPDKYNRNKFEAFFFGRKIDTITGKLQLAHKVNEFGSIVVSYAFTGLMTAEILEETPYAGVGLGISLLLLKQCIRIYKMICHSFYSSLFSPKATDQLTKNIETIIKFSTFGATCGLLLENNPRLGCFVGCDIAALQIFPKICFKNKG